MADEADNASLLCTRCGLCCNGVFFADVRLRKKDKPEQLPKTEVEIEQRKDGPYLLQPCKALGKHGCSIYDQRPISCRKFQCTLLKRTNSGELDKDEALKTIQSARRRIAHLEKLLLELGNNETHLPLTWRYESVFAEPWSNEEWGEIFDKRTRLYAGCNRLAVFLEKHFMEPV